MVGACLSWHSSQLCPRRLFHLFIPSDLSTLSPSPRTLLVVQPGPCPIVRIGANIPGNQLQSHWFSHEPFFVKAALKSTTVSCYSTQKHTFQRDSGRPFLSPTPPYKVRRLNITVDVLVNAAGVCRVGKLEMLDEEALNDQLQLNVIGTSFLTRLFAKGESRMHEITSRSLCCTTALPLWRQYFQAIGPES